MTDPWDDCIFTYMKTKKSTNMVGKYTVRPMDSMGKNQPKKMYFDM